DTTVGVLTDRLVYKAYDHGAGIGGAVGLAILDTSPLKSTPPTAPIPQAGGDYVQVPSYFGFIAIPADTQQGGQVTLISSVCGADGGTTCDVSRQAVAVPKTNPPSVGGQQLAFVTPEPPNLASIAAAWALERRSPHLELYTYPTAQDI